MRFIIFIIIGILIFSCKKVETASSPQIPITPEETIKFFTNIDTGVINIADTLSFTINLTSKIPPAGVICSIITNWTDSTKQIFKLDTLLIQSSLNLKIPGHKYFGNYNLSIIVTSKANTSNTASKIISFKNVPLERFEGYKVDVNARSLGTNYWTNVKFQPDLIISAFHEPLPGNLGYSLQGVTCGDFNLDGWIDVFNPGYSYNGPKCGVGFLIWNKQKKIFENNNLLNNKQTVIGGNPNKTIPVYLNSDNYIDLVIIDNGDEGISTAPAEPIRLLLSDGKGGYDIKEIPSESPLMEHESGDVGDLNNDGNPDLIIACNQAWFLMWGIKEFPYFSTTNMGVFHAYADNDPNRLPSQRGYKNNNGFGEAVSEISGNLTDIKIVDFNNDGWNDIILGTAENRGNDPYPTSNRIILNLGQGKFNKNSLVSLPFFDPVRFITGKDFICEDINNDGRKDIICVAQFISAPPEWDIFCFVQQSNGSFSIDKNIIKFNFPKKGTWKPKLFYVDINGDNQKDLGYFNDASEKSIMRVKSVFIREGSFFIEKDYFQFDAYAEFVKTNYLK